jgi:hypothetical protein
MSSNRLIYDTATYKSKLRENINSSKYAFLQDKYKNTAKCRIEFGLTGGNGVSIYNGNLVDLESDLRGQTRKASKAPSEQYQPECISNGKNNDGLPSGNSLCFGQITDQKTCKFSIYKNKYA